jgi:phosphate starvation-inducible PhoH-like protein
MTLKEARQLRASKQQAVAKAKPKLEPKTEAQAEYLEALRTETQVFGIGPAGTGKTYLAARHAMQQLMAGTKTKIVLSRTTVTKKKHQMGFAPGTPEEKHEHWLVNLLEALTAECGPVQLTKYRKEGQVVFLPFEHMRGRTVSDAVLILDEAQNCDFGDLKLFLTRTGENTQVLVNGDLDQVDIPNSGLATIIEMIDDYDVDATIVEFTEADVVRSKVAAGWVRAFREYREDQEDRQHRPVIKVSVTDFGFRPKAWANGSGV